MSEFKVKLWHEFEEGFLNSRNHSSEHFNRVLSMWVFTVSLSPKVLIYMSNIGFCSCLIGINDYLKKLSYLGDNYGDTRINEADGEVKSINRLCNGRVHYIFFELL